ncbi:MAG: C2H2-type zinc finger protein [Thermoplasmata archaeon]|nr:C2H2-type zinc finger protein [Thermoplasmata archaeon]
MPYVEYDEVGAACSECGRPFRSEEDLEEHRLEVHAAEGEFLPLPPKAHLRACPVCGERLAGSSAFRVHRRTAHRGSGVRDRLERAERLET